MDVRNHFRILHITDLHLTGETRSLDGQWQGVERCLAEAGIAGGIGALVVTGDLTQSATEEQYRNVAHFLSETVARDLRLKPSQIVLLPGNHDVAWRQDIWPKRRQGKRQKAIETRQVDKPSEAQRRALLSGLPCADWRLMVDRLQPRLNQATVSFVKPSNYWTRFEAFQTFYSKFYERDPHHLKRPLNLLSPVDEHYSLHVFESDLWGTYEGVAVFGFNSCHVNDEFWRGADIAQEAIDAAVRFGNEHLSNYFWVAAWHHGLASDQGDPAKLPWNTIRSLQRNRFGLGLHGHTHQDEFQDLTGWAEYGGLLRPYPMPIVATGSFGAATDETPRGQRNQVSVIDITRTGILWRVLELERAGWTPRSALAYRYDVVGGVPKLLPFSLLARSHRRKVVLRATGIADVTVTLEDLSASRDDELVLLKTPLQQIQPSQLDSNGQPYALVYHRGRSAAESRRLIVGSGGNGHTKYAINLRRGEAIARIEWAYRVANAWAVTARDCELRTGARRSVRLEPNQDAVLVRVHFPTEVLEVSVEFEGCDKTVDYECVSASGDATVDTDEEKNELRQTKVKRPGAALLIASHPHLAWQYGIRYSVVDATARTSSFSLQLASEFLTKCREKDWWADGETSRGHLDFPKALSLQFEETLFQHFKGELAGPLGPWLLFLWDQNTRQLRVALGRCPIEALGERFPYGHGLAGHVFRSGEQAAYVKHAGFRFAGERLARLLYVEGDSSMGLRAHEWILAIPVQTEDDTTVGVLVFADYPGAQNGNLSERMRKIASQHVGGAIADESRAYCTTIGRLAGKLVDLAVLDQAEHRSIG